MEKKEWIPEGIDMEKPATARIYDYMLGGYHNFASDREAGDAYFEVFPNSKQGVQANREFLRRVVHYLSQQGITQFLDLGSGIPTVGNVHEVAQKVHKKAKVVYVDIDKVAVAHSLKILGDNPYATAIIGNYEYPQAILSHKRVQEILDFSKPIALLFISGPHFIIEDEKAYAIVKTFMDALVPGSYLAISHATWDGHSLEKVREIKEMYKKFGIVTHERSEEEVMKFFDGLQMVPPGLINAPLWKNDEFKHSIWDIEINFKIWAGLAEKK